MYQSIHFTSTGRASTSASKPEVLESLRAIVGDENVVVDPEKVEPYGADAVKEKFPPEAVVFPESTEQMVAILKLANEYLFPVTARGGGVGYTGGAVPIDGGIVIGTDRMNRIIEINVDDLYAICQPGITTYALQQAAAEVGLLFAPDPASYKDSFIGGNIAENAGGMRTPKYGVTKHHVLGLEVVTATGEVIHTGGKTVKNVVGFDLTGLMCGSEGMLGIITEATLKLLPMPEATSTVRANFHSMEAACKVLTKFTPEGLLPMAMEVIDKYCVAAVEENFAFGLSPDAAAILLVAVDGSREEVEKNAITIERIIGENGGFDILRARSKEEEDKLWDVRRAISPSLMKYGTLKINEDVVVPRSRVPELVARIEEIGKRHNTFVANFGHAGDGNIHVNFVVDRDDPDQVARARMCVAETFALSVELGGTISGEHGIGYVKSAYMGYALDKPTIDVMKAIKNVFDPNGILNPGKCLCNNFLIMKIKALLPILAAFGLIAFTHLPAAAENKKIIILARHAEKAAATEMDKTGDVDLSAEGRERAERLAKAVKKYRPQEIFATDYKRTKQTAEPIAKLRDKEIQTYDPAKQADLVTKVLASKTGRYLIVGHSNTIPALANLIVKKELFKQLPDTEYGVFWVIRMKRGVVTRVEVYPY